MGIYKFAYETKEKTARAQVMDRNCSYKDLVNICNAISQKPASEAKKIMEDAIDFKKAIPYLKFNTGLGHRSDLGGKKGRYPQKESKIMLKLLGSAVANAVAQGMDAEKLFVANAQANKQNKFPRYRRFFVGSVTLGYGKQAFRSDLETAKAEITIVERDVAKKKERRKKGAKNAPAQKTAQPAAKVNAQPTQKAEAPAQVKAESPAQEKVQ